VKPFAYERADSLGHALALAARPGARFIAGGTNLVDLMKLEVETPELLVDVTGLPMAEVTETEDAVRVGATVRNSDMVVHPLVRARFPVLVEAVLAGASGQLRNMATTGGNLMQRTRCFYFQDRSKPCNKRVPGSGCPARDGISQNLAILGTSEHCIATSPSDLAVALSALSASVQILDGDGARTVAIGDFFRVPGDDPTRETTLAPGALITGIEIPKLAPGAVMRYRKARERASYAFAVGSVATILWVADGVVTDVRIALGAVAPVPWRARVAERALRGAPATPAAFREAAEAELAAARPREDNAYKVPLATNLLTRVLSDLAAEAVEA
jgi:xanthine dehydrogenase YagS FAD-binding subunit